MRRAWACGERGNAGARAWNLIGCTPIHARLANADLHYSDLSHTNLLRADLSRADLTGAWFIRSGLLEARLHQADLRSAVFWQTLLEGADLRAADFTSADFTRARPARARLDEADLRGADFALAELINTTFDRAIADDTTVWPKGQIAAEGHYSLRSNDSVSGDAQYRHLGHAMPSATGCCATVAPSKKVNRPRSQHLKSAVSSPLPSASSSSPTQSHHRPSHPVYRTARAEALDLDLDQTRSALGRARIKECSVINPGPCTGYSLPSSPRPFGGLHRGHPRHSGRRPSTSRR